MCRPGVSVCPFHLPGERREEEEELEEVVEECDGDCSLLRSDGRRVGFSLRTAVRTSVRLKLAAGGREGPSWHGAAQRAEQPTPDG